MEQLGGIVVFVIGMLFIVGVLTAYFVWYGRWTARRWMKRAERKNAPKR